MHVLTAEIELHLPLSRSLKAKRAVLRPVLDRLRNRSGLAVAEVGFCDSWQRSSIGVAVVSASPALCEQVMDEVERTLWAAADLEVVAVVRRWLDTA